MTAAPTLAGKPNSKPSTHPPIDVGSILGGRYRVEGELGHGGMGTVYDAIDTETLEPVAVKVLGRRWSDEPLARARFIREAQATMTVDHPNIIRVIRFGFLDGEADNRPFLVMERLNGESMWHRVHRDGPLELHQVLSWVDQAASALAEVHASGAVHRDVKPENFVLHRPDPQSPEMVKLLDFGLVLRTEDEKRLTQEGCFVGTPEYMAPELATGTDSGPATDVYGLAATVYELLTGKPPHTGSSHFQVLTSKRTLPAPTLGEGGFDTSGGVEQVLAHALERDPAQRPQSTTTFAADLRAAAGTSSGPRKVARTPKLDSVAGAPKPASERRALAFFGGAIAVALVVLATLWMTRDLRSPTDPLPTVQTQVR